MKQVRDKAPSANDWAALCSAIMRCEAVLEKLAGDASLDERGRREAFAARLRKLEHEPAYRWLAAQPVYLQALEAFRRHVARDEVARFELLSAIGYAMETMHSDGAGETPAVTAGTRRQAARQANELAVLIAREGAGFAQSDADEVLLALLHRYVEDNEKLARVAPTAPPELTAQLRFGKDVAHLLWAVFGKAPASVVRPLLRLAGPPVSEKDVAALLGRMKREAARLSGRAPAGRKRYLLERIAIAPTSRSRKVAHNR